MKRITLLVFAVSLVMAGPVSAKLKVVATLSDLGQVAEAVGGEDIEVTVLCAGPTDPHYLPAKPSLARKLGQADLLIYNGLELEIGWLPSLIKKARNPKVRPGARGELDCSTTLHHVLEVPDGPVDRGHGDIHPLGNPHYTLDPMAMVDVAHALAERLSELDPPNADAYTARGEAFAADITARVPVWQQTLAAAGKHHILLYHQTWTYLIHWLDLDVYGEIEHRPGISPSPRHVQLMIEQGRRLGDVVVLAATWDHLDVARRAADRIEAPLAIVPAATGAEDGVDTYIALIDTIVARLAAAAIEGASR